MKCALLPMLFLAACFTGCTISSKSIGGGYHLRAMHYFSVEPPGVSESLYFYGSHGVRRQVWKNFTGPILVQESTVLFFGTTQPGEYELFAARDGGVCLEVGKPILAFEAERERTDVPHFVELHQLHTGYLKELSGGFELEYSLRFGVNNPPQHLSLTWNELSTIMRRVEAEGRPKKDRSGSSYLQIGYGKTGTLTTPSYRITIQGCEEYVASCDTMKYIGVNKKSRKSITLTGRTIHTTGADGVTPSHFLGYEFKSGRTTYFVGEDGILRITLGSKVLVQETGVWKW